MWLPSLLQLLAIAIDLYLLRYLSRGMARNYIWFSLTRSFVRVGAQWLFPIEQWVMIYWVGELLGYVVTLILIASLTEKVLVEHHNTGFFYASVAIFTTAIAIFTLPLPVTFNGLLRVGSVARTAGLFLLLLALVLGKGWMRREKWQSWGIVLNLLAQSMAGYFELHLGPRLEVSLMHQLGYLCLVGCWVIGIDYKGVEPFLPGGDQLTNAAKRM